MLVKVFSGRWQKPWEWFAVYYVCSTS